MKRKAKNLTLQRETLQILQDGEDRRVAGGTATSMACFQATGCDCASWDCYAPTLCLGTCSFSIRPC